MYFLKKPQRSTGYRAKEFQYGASKERFLLVNLMFLFTFNKKRASFGN